MSTRALVANMAGKVEVMVVRFVVFVVVKVITEVAVVVEVVVGWSGGIGGCEWSG